MIYHTFINIYRLSAVSRLFFQPCKSSLTFQA